MPLGLASSELVALCIESVLYGNPPLHSIQALVIRFSLLPSRRPTFVSVSRGVRCIVHGMRQGPMPQAKAKGGWESPPDRGLVNSLRPDNMGSFLAYITTPLGPHPLGRHSMKSSMAFVFTLPTSRARHKARICTTASLPRCSVS
jgi:hypothetical protein